MITHSKRIDTLIFFSSGHIYMVRVCIQFLNQEVIYLIAENKAKILFPPLARCVIWVQLFALSMPLCTTIDGNYIGIIQLTLQTHRFCVYGFNQRQMEIISKEKHIYRELLQIFCCHDFLKLCATII